MLFDRLPDNERLLFHPHAVEFEALMFAQRIREELKGHALQYFRALPFPRTWFEFNVPGFKQTQGFQIINREDVEVTSNLIGEVWDEFTYLVGWYVDTTSIIRPNCAFMFRVLPDESSYLEMRYEFKLLRADSDITLVGQNGERGGNLADECLVWVLNFLTASNARKLIKHDVTPNKLNQGRPAYLRHYPSVVTYRITRTAREYMKQLHNPEPGVIGEHWVRSHLHGMPRWRNGVCVVEPEIIPAHKRGNPDKANASIRKRNVKA